jgi:hypothetical protein
MTAKKTSSKKIVPKHMSQAEEPYDSDESSFSASKPWGADKTTKKTASKKRVSKPYDSDESSVSASKLAGADTTKKKTASKKGFPNKQRFNWKNHLTLKNCLALHPKSCQFLTSPN